VVPAPLRLAPGITVDPDALTYTTSRSSGPGGQHVNTADTRVTLRVPLAALCGGDGGFHGRLRILAGSRLTEAGELVISCDETRSQARNRELCLERLRELATRAAKRPRKRKPTKPTRAAKERRLQAKARNSEKKSRRRPPAGE